MSSTDTGSEQGAVPKFVNLSASAFPVVMAKHALVRSSRQRLAAQLFLPMLLGTSPVGRSLHVVGSVPQLPLELR